MGVAAGMSFSEEFDTDKGQEDHDANHQPAITRVALLNLVA